MEIRCDGLLTGRCRSHTFKKRRVFEYQKEQTLRKLEAEGATSMEGSGAGGAAAAAMRGR